MITKLGCLIYGLEYQGISIFNRQNSLNDPATLYPLPITPQPAWDDISTDKYSKNENEDDNKDENEDKDKVDHHGEDDQTARAA